MWKTCSTHVGSLTAVNLNSNTRSVSEGIGCLGLKAEAGGEVSGDFGGDRGRGGGESECCGGEEGGSEFHDGGGGIGGDVVGGGRGDTCGGESTFIHQHGERTTDTSHRIPPQHRRGLPRHSPPPEK